MSLEQKQTDITQFVQYNVKNIQQRSQQWYDIRKISFGGSEIAPLMGQCKYNKSHEIYLKDKSEQKQKNFADSMAVILNWGIFFEPIHRKVIELVFNTIVVEASMAQGSDHMQGCHQSPDGICTVKTQTFLQHVQIPSDWKDQSLFQQEYINVLLEQKAPARRIPDDKIPDNYVGQVKLGLGLFTICDIGCYSDGVFKITSLNKLFQQTTDDFNRNIIKSRFVKSTKVCQKPQYIGIVQISVDSVKTICSRLCTQLPTKKDLSLKLDEQFFNKMVELQLENKLEVEYSTFKYEYTEDLKAELTAIQTGENYYFYWMLQTINFIAVERSSAFNIIMGVFVNLGQKVIQEHRQCKIMNSKLITTLKDISQYMKQEKFPLVGPNLQDQWFTKEHQNHFKVIVCKNYQNNWKDLVIYMHIKLYEPSLEDRQKILRMLKRLKTKNMENVNFEHCDRLQNQLECYLQSQLEVMEVKEDEEEKNEVKTQDQNIDVQMQNTKYIESQQAEEEVTCQYQVA